MVSHRAVESQLCSWSTALWDIIIDCKDLYAELRINHLVTGRTLPTEFKCAPKTTLDFDSILWAGYRYHERNRYLNKNFDNSISSTYQQCNSRWSVSPWGTHVSGATGNKEGPFPESFPLDEFKPWQVELKRSCKKFSRIFPIGRKIPYFVSIWVSNINTATLMVTCQNEEIWCWHEPTC